MKLDPTTSIDNVALTDIVNDFLESGEYANFTENLEYYKGQNPSILQRKVPIEIGAPDNRLPVSYARRIINLVTGYMYKPGLVSYASEDEKYLAELKSVFDANNEPIKTEQVGKQVSIQGVGYEYHYVTGDQQGDAFRVIPRFVKLPAVEVIPIYDWAVEPKLWSFVRRMVQGKNELAWVYYKDRWEKFSRDFEAKQKFELVETGTHYYGDVPLAVYANNEEMIGDFEPVQQLIDAYDVLVSDSMNEFDRFSFAYLLLKGMSLSPETAERLKETRAFENLSDEAQISFLTKDMETDFIKFMSDLVRDEIHRQSGIPNLEDYDASGASGKTMGKFIYLMELFTDPKESYFKQGLYRRIELINKILKYGEEPGRVEVIMSRNKPDASLEQAEIFRMYSGLVSHETLLNNFADFVDNPQEEIDRLAKERPPINASDFEDEDEEEENE